MRRIFVLAVVVVVAGVMFPVPAHAEQRVVMVAFYRYSPSPIELAPGDTLAFINSDPSVGSWDGHSVTHAAPPGEQLFDSAIIPPGGSGEVNGVAELEPGSYNITCRIHAFMTGVLTVGRAS